MMVAPKADAGGILGLVVTAGAPVAADGPDFAAMMASLGSVEPGASVKPVPQIEPAEPAVTLSAASMVTADAVLQVRDEHELDRGGAPQTVSPSPTRSVVEALEGPKPKDVPSGMEAPEMPRMLVATTTAQSPEATPTRRLVAEDQRETGDREHDAATTAEKSPHVSNDINAVIMTIAPIAAPEPGIADIAPLRVKLSSRRVGESGGDAKAAQVSADRPDLSAANRSVGPLDVTGSRPAQELDSRGPTTPVVGEMRIPVSTSPMTIDKLMAPMPDRVSTFPGYVADAAHDILRMTGDADMRFNVRPETLGQIAVTIQRSEAGLGLRLGVETPAAVQAVRQAEPMLNDVRGHVPFAHVSVDLNSPDTRGRSARVTPLVRRARGDDREIMLQPAPVTTGRYA